ncbi:MAG: autotransporter-associated beta strand repeat-containing protein [Rubrivivax sp.]|nr:autotransporter-associated beta strand repeat-containing protein [Rubrivivax sp.]
MNPSLRPAARAAAVATARRRDGFALRPISLAACLAAAAPAGFALPQGEVPTFGEATVSRPAAGRMDIRQSTPRAGLDWTSFSIAAGERVDVRQPSRDAVLLNRVLGDDPSLIYGSLTSNGSVWLINPRGIVFGASSRVDVGSLVASTLVITQDDLASGRLQLGRGAGAGALRADGDITADGSVVLVAPQLDMGGRITAPRVGLAAASEVLVDLDGDGLVFFNVRNDALESRLQMLGRVRADGGVADLRAAARAGLTDTVLNLEGVVQARTLGVREGRIVIDGGGDGVTRVAGMLDARGAGAGTRGGDVLVQGNRILLDGGARIDASGTAGGGSVRVGGDFQGANADVRNAAMVSVRAGARLDASATNLGDAGRVIVWSDDATRFAGHAAARGGAQGGDGGLVEVSGKGYLDYRGSADLTASAGRFGTLLLDPTNILIEASAPDINGDGTSGDDLGPGGIDFADPGVNSRITASALVTQLAAGNVELQANNNVTVNAEVNSGSANSLTLRGGGAVAVSAPVTVGGDLTLSANDPGASTRNAAAAVTVGAALDVGGALTLNNNGGTGAHAIQANLSAGTVSFVGNVTRSAGSTTWTLSGDSTVGSDIGGAVPFTKAGAGTLVLAGTLTATTVTIDGGTLQAGNGSLTGTIANTGALTINAAGTLAIHRSGNVTVADAVATSATIAGNGTFRKAGGAGTLTIGGTMSGVSAVEIAPASGSLVLGDDDNDRIGSTAAVTVGTGSVFDIGNNVVGIGSLSLGGSLALAAPGALTAASLTLTDGGNVNVPVAITGTITAASGASQISSTTTGATVQVNDTATLTVGNAAAFANTAAVTVASGGTLTLGVAKQVATLDLTGTLGGDTFALTASGGITLRDGALVQTPTAGGTLTVSAGAGSATLQRASSAATVAVTTGTLLVDTGGSLDDAAAVTVAGGATLQVDAADAIGALVLAGTLDGAATLTTSTLTADGTAANLRSTLEVANNGSATVSSGTLTVGDGTTAGEITFAGAGTLEVDTGATLSFDRDGPITLATIGGAGGTLRRAGGSGALTLTGTAAAITSVVVDSGSFVLADGNDNRLNDNASVSVASAATFTLGTSNEQIGSLALSGTLGAASGVLTAGTYTLQGGSTVSGNLGSGAISTAGAGSVAFDGTASATTVNVANGTTLALGAAAALGSSAAVTVGSTATLDVGGASTIGSLTLTGTLTGSATLTTGTLTANGTGANIRSTLALSGTGTVTSGTLTVGDGATAGAISGGTLNVNTGATLAFDRDGPIALGSIGGTGGTLRRAGGSGALTLTGTAPSLTAVVVDSGSFVLADGSSNRLNNDADVTVAAGATFTTGNQNETVQSLVLAGTLSGTGTLTADDYTLQPGAQVTSPIGSGDLVVSGAGSATLNATAGVATVNVGNGSTLVLGASSDLSGSADVTVVAGGTLTLGRNDTIDDLTLAGTLNGAFTLTASGGTTLQTGGLIAFGTIVDGGTLTTTGNATLAGHYGGNLVVVAPNGRLALTADSVLVPAGQEHINNAATLTLSKQGNQRGTIQLAINETVAEKNGGGIVEGPGQLIASTLVLVDDEEDGNNVTAGALISRGTSSITGNVDLGGGGATVESGSLTIGNGNNGGTLTAGSIVVDAGAALAYNRNGTIAVSSAISGDGTLRQTGGNSGTGELQITGTATTAFVDVAGGTLSLAAGNDNRLSDTAAVTVASGRTLRLDNAGETIGTLDLAGTLSGVGALTATTYTLNAGATASAALGTGTLNVAGNGTLGGTAGVGAVNVNAGTLTLGATNRFGNTPTLVIAGGARLLLNGDEAVGNATIAGTLDRSAAGNRLVASAAELQGGASVVADLTGGPLTVTGNATMSGASGAATVAVDAGTFTLGAANVLAAAADVTVAAGAGLAIGSNAQSVNAFTSAGALTGSATLQSATGYALNAGASVTANLGSGPLTVSGDASLSGTSASADVAIVGGTFTLTGDNRLAGVADVDVAAGATLALNGNLTMDLLNVAGSVSGSGRTLTASTTTLAAGAQFGANLGPGTLVVNGNAGLSGTAGIGALVINAGTLTLTGADRFTAAPAANVSGTLATGGSEALGSLVGSGDVVLGGGTLSVGDVTDGTFSGRILGSGNLRKTGIGTLELMGANAYSGSTQVAEGILWLNGDERLPDTTALTVDAGATLRAGSNETVAQLTIAGTLEGLGTLTAPTYALTGGTVAATAGLGAGTLTSTGSSTLAGTSAAGTVQVDSGTLSLGAAERLDDNADVTVAAGATLALSADETVRSLTLAGTLDGMGFTLSTGDRATLQAGAQVLANLGSGRLDVIGDAQLGGTSAAGTVDVQAGTLSLAIAERLFDTADVTVAAGATLSLGGAERVGTLTLAGTLASANQLDATTVTLQAGALVQADVAATTLLVQGDATLQGQALVASAQIDAGTLTLAQPERIADTAALTLAAGATLQLGSNDETVASAALAGTLAGSGTLTAATYTLDGATIAANLGSGTLTSTGATALNGSAAATAIDVLGGTLSLGAADRLADAASLTVAAGATLVLGGNDTVTSLSLSGTLDGNGTLTATAGHALAGGTVQAGAALGAGSLTSTGASLLAGTAAATTVNVDSGTLTLGSVDRLADTAAVGVATGATLALGGNDSVGSLTLAGTLAGSGTLTAATYTLAGGTVDVPLGAGALTSTGNSTLNAGAGATTVAVDAGTLVTGGADLLAANAAVSVAPGATLQLGGAQTLGSLVGGGDVDLGPATLTTGALADSSFDGRLLGSGGLTKVGAATTLSLGGANAYGGATQVLQGTLRTTAADVLPDASAVSVSGGATLEVGGNDTVASLALVGRIAGSGTLTAATYDLDGGTVDASLGAGVLSSIGSSRINETAAADTVNIDAGTLTLGAAERLNDGAFLRVAAGATLVLNGNDRVGAVDAAGTITGTGQLSASSYLLTGGLYELDLGDGTLTSTGDSTFNGTSAATAVNVTSGRLTLVQANTFGAQPAVSISAGAAMALAGDETFGSLAGGGDLALGSATLITGALGDSSFGGTIAGSDSSELRKVGGGTFALSGNQDYTGTTRVEAGTLAVTGTLASRVIAVDGGTLALGSANRLADAAAVAVAGGAEMTLTGDDTVASLVLSGTLGGNGTLTAATYLLDGGLVEADLGAGALSSRSLSTLRGRSAADTLSVQTGTLTLGSATRLIATPAVDVAAGAALALGGDETFGALTGDGIVELGAATLTTGALGDAVFGGAITGSGGLVKVGPGTVTLGGTNTYTGATRVTAGTLAVTGTLASATLQVEAGTLALGGADRLADNAAVTVAAGALMTLAGDDTIASLQLAGRLAGNGRLSAASYALDGATVEAELGSGTLSSQGNTLLAGRSDAGSVSIDGGTLTLGAAARFGALPALAVAAGATLATTGDEALGSLAAAGTLSGTGTLSAATYALDGANLGIALGSGALASRGSTLLAQPSAADSVAVETGTLTLQPAARLTASPAVTVAGGATLALGSDQTMGLLAGAGTVSLGATTLTTGARGDSTFAGTLAGSGGLVKAGSSRFVLEGASTYTGTTRVTAGTVALGGTLASASVLVDAGTLALGAAERLADGATLGVAAGAAVTLAGDETVAAVQLAGRLGGTGTLAAATYALDGATVEADLGRGTLTSRGASRLDGRAGANSVAVDAGTLTLGAADRLADDAALAVATGATLALGGDDSVASLALAGTLGGSGTLSAATYALDSGEILADLGSGRLTSRGDSTLAGRAAVGEVAVTGGTLTLTSADRVTAAPAVDVSGGAMLAMGGAQTFGTLTGSGGMLLGNHELTTGSAGDSRFTGVIAGSGSLRKEGDTSFTLTGANTYTGITTVAAGTLRVGDGGSAGSLASSGYQLAGRLVIDRSDEVTLAQPVAGSGGVTQAGSGRLRFGGGNKTYTGDTLVASGELATLGDEQLPDGSVVRVDAPARLALGGGETLRALEADGPVVLAGDLTAAEDLRLRAAVTVPGNQALTLSGRVIEALDDGNRWGSSLAIDARGRVELDSGREAGVARDLVLGRVTVADGGRVDAGTLDLSAASTVGGGLLELVSSSAARIVAPPPEADGKQAVGLPIAFADDEVRQTGGEIRVAAGAGLRIAVAEGASVQLLAAGNEVLGELSVLSGAEGSAWTERSTPGSFAGPTQNYALQGRVRIAGSTLVVGGSGVEADLVAISADRLTTVGDARIVARLPFDNTVGTAASLPALTLELTPTAFAINYPYGQPGAEIRVDIGSRALGNRTLPIDAGYLTVLPRGGAQGSTAVLLSGPQVAVGGYRFFFDGAGIQGEIPVFYNGLLPVTPAVENSISATVSVSESARKQRFEEAVRTENVAVRLRAGVIAEVGPGRPATEGSQGLRLPQICPPAGTSLGCGPGN